MPSVIQKLGKDTVLYGLGNAFIKFLSLIMIPIFTDHLTPEQYGILGIISLFALVIQPIFGLGQSMAMGPAYFESEKIEQRSRVLWTVFGITLASALSFCLIFLQFSNTFMKFIGLFQDDYNLYKTAIYINFINIITFPFMQTVQFERRSIFFVITVISTAILSIGVSYIAIVHYDANALGILIGQLIGAIFNLLIVLLFCVSKFRIKFSFSLAKRLFIIGLPLIPSFAMMFLLLNGSRYLLQKYHGFDAVGIYFVGFSFAAVMLVVVSGFQSAWYPFYMSYKGKETEIKDIFSQITFIYCIISGAICLVIILLSELLTAIFLPDEYSAASNVIGFIASAYFFMGLYSIFLPKMYFSDEIWAQTLVQFVAVLIALPLNFFFVIYFGIAGAAFAVLLGHILLVVTTLLWNEFRRQRYHYIMYKYRNIIKILIIYSFVGVLSYINS
jgi:O-antigen/teichoic acid export membrane protein